MGKRDSFSLSNTEFSNQELCLVGCLPECGRLGSSAHGIGYVIVPDG